MVDPFPFATPAELRDRWPDFPPGAESHAQVLLEDASQFILDVCPTAASVSASTRRRIVCSVVRRTMESSVGGVEQTQETAGPFSYTERPVNPHGDFYLTRQEKRALGEGRQVAFGAVVASRPPLQRHRPWCSLAFGATYCSCGADLTGEGPLWEG